MKLSVECHQVFGSRGSEEAGRPLARRAFREKRGLSPLGKESAMESVR